MAGYPARVHLAKAWWSGDAWRCPEFPHNPFRGHSEIPYRKMLLGNGNAAKILF